MIFMYKKVIKENILIEYLEELFEEPQAQAMIKGSDAYRGINGRVTFYATPKGVLVGVEVTGLPEMQQCENSFLGFHIHEGASCGTAGRNAFAGAGMHYNPNNCAHPAHAGDLPPLLVNNGQVFMVFLTDNFAIRDIVGKTVVIHSKADDFTSQPAGNSGDRIACGEIYSLS